MADDSDLIPIFMPALSVLLISAEDKKGEPLTLEEVLRIRDESPCMMVRPEHAAKLTESRGRDLDPENCWCDWQMLRRELGREPDLDPGARMHMVRNDDPAYLATIENAQATLEKFRGKIPQYDPASVMVKTRLEDENGYAFVWLFNVRSDSEGFAAELFEIPNTIPSFRVGDVVEIAAADVLDWMINDAGTLYGGYSLRHHREGLDESEKQAFDEYIGAVTYA